MVKRSQETLHQRRYTANKHTERCSVSTVIKKLQIQAKLRYYCIPIRMVKINKNLIIPNAGGDVEQWELSFIAQVFVNLK